MTGFDDMEKAEIEPYWCHLTEDGGYRLELDDETEIERDEPLVGTVTNVDEGVGPNNSRLYTIETESDPRPIKLWGSGHLDNQFDQSGLGTGSRIGVRKTGETFETRNGEADEIELRYTR